MNNRMRIVNAILLPAVVLLSTLSAIRAPGRGVLGVAFGLVVWATPLFLAWRAFSTNATQGSIQAARLANAVCAFVFASGSIIALVSIEGQERWHLLVIAGLAIPFALNFIALTKLRRSIPDVPIATVPVVLMEQARGNYFARHWRGDLSLGVSYWVNAVMLPAGIAVLAQGAEAAATDYLSLRGLATVALILIATGTVTFVWAVVGVWRSAGKHVARGGKSGWAVTAKVLIVITVLAFLGRLPTSVIPNAEELARIAAGSDPLEKIGAQVTKDGLAVILFGTFGEGSSAVVEKILSEAQEAKVVVLQSSGGRTYEAMKVAQMVRQRALDTYVEAECSSACTQVFLAGKVRAITANARLGFHLPHFAGIDPKMKRIVAQETMDEYRALGLPDWFVQKIGKTPTEEMWYPTRDELIKAHVVTHVVK